MRKPHFWNLQPVQGIVNGTSQNWQPFQGRRISRMPKTTKAIRLELTFLFPLSGNLTWRWNIPIYGIQKSCTNGWFSIARLHCWRVTIEHSRRIQAWNQSRVQHSSPMPFAGPHGCWKGTSCPCRLVEMGNGDDPRNGRNGMMGTCTETDNLGHRFSAIVPSTQFIDLVQRMMFLRMFEDS